MKVQSFIAQTTTYLLSTFIFLALGATFLPRLQAQNQIDICGTPAPQWSSLACQGIYTTGDIGVGHVGLIGEGWGTRARFNVGGTTKRWQMRLYASGASGGSWYVGATNNSWQAGGGKLLFSPADGSNNSVLTLTKTGRVGILRTNPSYQLDVNGGTRLDGNTRIEGSESNGTVAALRIYSGSQIMKLDGNEIDTESTMYLNYNSTGNMSLAYGGGDVAVGGSSNGVRFGVADEGWQMRLNNTGTAGGDWYIGSSNSDWNAGGGKLVFSPTAASGNSALTLTNAGLVGIGTNTPNAAFRLSVNGAIRAKEIVVEAGWSDFVFEDDYELRSLEEVQAFIDENGHLPDVPSAKEIEEHGVAVGEIESRLLQKIEELTLYILDQEARIKALESHNNQ